MNTIAAQTWLILRNDLRLLWRHARGKAYLGHAVIVLLFAFFHVLSFAYFFAARRSPSLTAETIGWFLFGFIMFGAAMNHAVGVLFERADFDLLLASPVSPRAILLARLTAMTAAAALSVALFMMPLLNGAIFGVTPGYAWGYLVWLLLAVAVASVGVWATLFLVRWLGPRRARTWAQVAAAVLGALVYVVFQGQNLLPAELRVAFAAKMARVFAHPALALVARAGHGEWRPLLGLAAIATVLALLTTRLLARLFITGIQESLTVKPARSRAGHYRFVSGLNRATFWKDVRLIARDPLLLARTLPSVAYLVPVLFSVGRMGKADVPGLLAPFCVLCTTLVSTQLTAVAAGGEEGWDLIRMSPASTRQLRVGKIAAGMALPAAVGIMITVVIALLGRPGLAVAVLVTALACASASCWVEVAEIRPTPRKDLVQRRSLSRPFSASRMLVAAVFFIAGAGGASLAANGKWLLATVAFGIVTLSAIACFTLVEVRDIEFEAAPPPGPPGG